MDEQTPPPVESGQYASYPRQAPGGIQDAAKLYYAARSYWSMNLVLLPFLTFVISYVALGALSAAKPPDPGALLIAFASLAVSLLCIWACTVYSALQLGKALGQSPILYAFLGILFGCIGIIGLAILQSLALAEVKKFGLRTGCFRPMRKKDVEALWQELCRQQGLPVQKLNIFGKAVM